MNQVAHWVMDYETLSNCIVLCVEHYKEEIEKTFVIHELWNDFEELVEFIQNNRRNGERHISFNGLSFDSQITQYILNNRTKLSVLTPEQIAFAIYGKAQDVINRQERREWQEFPEHKLSIAQIDVFKMNHWDNFARSTSLKWAQYTMDWPNIQEMPIHHSTYVETMEELETIVNYCKNDVKSTKKILHLCKSQVNLRKRITEKYGVSCYSYSNTKIGSELLLKLYCEKTKKNKWDVKKSGTRRDEIILDNIIFPYISFKTPEFKGLLEKIRSKVMRNTRGEISYVVNFKGAHFDIKSGGIHQCIASGIYESDDEYTIQDIDVASLYPDMAVKNEMYPAHLGREFFEVYKNDVVDVRLAEKRKGADGDRAIVEGFKEAANATYGNSNSEHSWLYDPQYTMQTTINGQLMISMLVEEMLTTLTNPLLLQTNTDGATLRIKRSEVDQFREICKRWEEITKLTLEFAEYSKMFIWDVNNYIAVYTSGKTKCKGRFEWEDIQNYKPTHLHKNKSHLIIPKAIFHYFVKDTPPETYLVENRNILDYCAGAKIKGEWEAMQTCVIDGKVVYEPLQSITRYYISKTGCKIIKSNRSDGRKIQLESGKWLQTVFNVHVQKPWEEYNVDESYYLEKIYKEIDNILPKVSDQLKLEF
jgi:hypothetical protein